MIEILFVVIFCWILYGVFVVILDFIKKYKLQGILFVVCSSLILYGIINLLIYFNIPGYIIVFIGEIGLISWLLWELFTKCNKEKFMNFLKGIWK